MAVNYAINEYDSMSRFSRRMLALFLVVEFVASFLGHIFVSVALAASSPWTQTDWSTGNFSTGSHMTTSTSGQVTLTPQEKLTNTGFETDLASWTATPTSFADESFHGSSGAIAAWPLDETVSTQLYTRTVNPADTEGRNIVLNGGFNTDTLWAKQTGWTIAGGVASANASLGALLSQSLPIIQGKYYQVTFTVLNYVSGGVRPIVATVGGSGSTVTANGTYTQTILAGSNTTFAFYVEASGFVGDIDNVSVKEINIPSSMTPASNLLTDGTMETAGTASWTAINSATLTKQTGTPYAGSQVLRVARNGVSTPGAAQTVLSSGSVYRVYGYARSDGSATPIVRHGTTTIWTGTTSTTWQSFDVVFISGATDLRISTTTNTGSQYVEFDNVVVSADTSVRSGEILQDSNMEASGTSYYSALNSTILSKDTSNPHGGTQALRTTYNGTTVGALRSIFVVGKTYRITGYARGDGTAIPRVGDAALATAFIGTSSSSWQFFDIIRVVTNVNLALYCSASSGSQYCEFDDVSVTEVSPLVGLPTNGVVIATASGANGHLTNAYSFDGTNDNVNLYSTDLNSTFNPSEGTLVAWAKVANAGAWTDGLTRNIVKIALDNNNRIEIYKRSSNNQIAALYSAGGTTINPQTSFSSTGWFQVAMTWSKSDNSAKFYINAAQQDNTSGLGTWDGNLASTTVAIGSSNSAGSTPWSGLINDVRLYNRALTDTEIANLYSGITATRDTGTKYTGTASAKLVTYDGYNGSFTQSVNVGDTSTYQLEANAYTSGGAVTSSDLELYYNGAVVATTYTDLGSGWYKLTGTVVGVASAVGAGVSVKGSKTVYLDTMSLWKYPSTGTLTSSIFDSGQGSNWGTLTYTASTPINTTAAIKIRTSDSATMTGATDFASCASISSGSDVSSNSCVTDSHRYAQYQLTLSTTDPIITATFQDFSLSFSVSDAVGPTIELDAPADNSYTNSDRPVFRFKAATDADSTVTDYDFTIDNPQGAGESAGDFTITDIPISRTTDFVTSKYTVHYDGFDDADTNNNYISLYTVSSADWSHDAMSGENDGKLRAGLVTWSVSVQDSANNLTVAARNLFVDLSPPQVRFTQINNEPIASVSYETTDQTPTIYGEIVDTLAGTDISRNQDASGPRVASGPKQMNLKIERKYLGIYKTHTLNIDRTFYACSGLEITDNKSQLCDKKLPFKFLPEEPLAFGTYKISLSGQDRANNAASDTSLILVVAPPTQQSAPKKQTEELKQVPKQQEPIPKEDLKDRVEITKPITPPVPNIFDKLLESSRTLAKNTATLTSFVMNRLVTSGNLMLAAIHNSVISFEYAIGEAYSHLAQGLPSTIRGVLLTMSREVNAVITIARIPDRIYGNFKFMLTGQFMGYSTLAAQKTRQIAANATFFVGQTAQHASADLGFSIVKLGYLLVDEPTTISNVQEEILSHSSVKITWKTNHPATGKVNYGFAPGDYDFEVQTSKRTTDHEFIITDLTPNTEYHFEVISQNQNFVYDANRTFRTLNQPVL